MKYSNNEMLKDKARAYFNEHKDMIEHLAGGNEMMFVAGAMFAMQAIDQMGTNLHQILNGQFN